MFPADGFKGETDPDAHHLTPLPDTSNNRLTKRINVIMYNVHHTQTKSRTRNKASCQLYKEKHEYWKHVNCV